MNDRGTCLAVALALTPPAAAGAFDPWNEPARYEVEYTADLSVLADASSWRLWLPVPTQNAVQRLLDLEVSAPAPYRVTRDALGNRYVFVEGEGTPAAALVVRFAVERLPLRGFAPAAVASDGARDPQRFLRPARRIPLDGLIARLAEQESRGLESDAEKIRAFYDYVVRIMRYGKDGEGWGNGDAVWACTSRYGNCTDFHSLFIGMARSQGIPARFVMGFPIPSDEAEGSVSGYHCWAEVYERGRGWLPLDASEAKKSGRADAYFGALPSDRIEFTLGRDLTLEPPQAGEPLNYAIYPYAEADGEPLPKVPFTLRYRRLPAETALLR